MTEQIKVPYGYCPKCGAHGKQRERRPFGDDICARGCKYPSRESLPEPKVSTISPPNITFSEIEEEDAFAAESDDEVLKWVKR